jgi:hypothetical protein
MTKKHWDMVGHCVCGSQNLFSFEHSGCHLRCLDCGREICGRTWNNCLKNWKIKPHCRRRQERPALIFGRRKLKGGASRIVGHSSSQG